MITAIFVSPQRAAQIQQAPQQIEKIAELLGAKETEIIHPYERFPDLALINEKDASSNGKPFCRALYDEHGKLKDLIYGTFVIVNYADSRCMALTKGQVKHFLSKFSKPEAISVENGCLTVKKIGEKQKDHEIISELFDGDYNPSRSKIQDKGYSERIDVASKLLDNLVSQMNPQLQLLLDDYLRCRAEAQIYAEKLIFIEGIKPAKALSDAAT